jgi:alkyl hydroperoxide reductase subunit AhpC
MPDDSFKKVSISDYLGKYVCLYFWPADFTFVCASETIDFHKKLSEFKSRDCEVIGCSIDTHHVHKAWKNTTKEHGGLGTPINHPMVADIQKEISKSYGVLLDSGLSARGVFIIDKEGKVRCEMKNDDPIGRNVDEVIRVLESVKFTDEHEDQVCPAGWKPGAATMQRSTESVAEYLTKYT